MDAVCSHAAAPGAPTAPADKLEDEISACAADRRDNFHVTDAELPASLWFGLAERLHRAASNAISGRRITCLC